MDHITRCPNCATAFRVTDAQLTAYQGKVRCGRCALVFNARETLLPTPSPTQRDDVPSAESPERQISTEHAIEHPVQPVQEASEPTGVNEGTTAAIESSSDHIEQASTDALNLRVQENIVPDAEKQGGSYRPIAIPEDDALFAPLPKPRHAGIWLFATGLAALVLLAQILFAYRMTLAMEFPALQPRLIGICAQLGCEMPLPRQADRLRLEWSELTFVPDHPTLIQLSATLRNLAQYEQAMPMLELTLTDNQEHIVARRVFKPLEYLAENEKNRHSLRAQEELHAFLQLEIGEMKSTGYSLYWFYE